MKSQIVPISHLKIKGYYTLPNDHKIINLLYASSAMSLWNVQIERQDNNVYVSLWEALVEHPADGRISYGKDGSVYVDIGTVDAERQVFMTDHSAVEMVRGLGRLEKIDAR